MMAAAGDVHAVHAMEDFAAPPLQDIGVGRTIAPTVEKIRALMKTYEPYIFDSAAHGFLRARTGNNGANMKATEQAWPMTIEWLKKYTAIAAAVS